MTRIREQLRRQAILHRGQLDQMHKACATVAYAAQYERQERDRQAEILTDLLASDVDGRLAVRVERIVELQKKRHKVINEMSSHPLYHDQRD
eukprot:SAG31_NODE_10585_length_1121_cov_1.241683_2_plen_92_part_00